MEDGSDSVEDTKCYVSTCVLKHIRILCSMKGETLNKQICILHAWCIIFGRNLRAEDGQAKSCKRQVTQSIVAVFWIITCVRSGTKTVETSVGSGQDSDGDKTTDEKQVENDKQPAKEFGSATLEAEVDYQSRDSVGCCSCQNAFNRAGRVVHIANETVDLVETRRKETERTRIAVSAKEPIQDTLWLT